MRTLWKFAVLPGALAVAALVSFLAPRAGAVVPSDIAGTYAGKVNFKFFPMTEGTPASRGSDEAEATVTYDPPNLFVNITVHTDDGDILYTLMGSYGLGRFHASGGGPGGQATIAGKATGAAGKIKLTGTGFNLPLDSVTELKFVLKQQAP